jgi:transcriptional regulator with XRE-family HTH domain
MPTPTNLRHYRLKRHLTQQQVLKSLGHASASRLSAWENGEAVPSSKHLVILSELYRVSIDKLVGGYAKKQKKPVASPHEEVVLPVYGSQYKQHFGKEYEEMTEEELLEQFAQLLVEAFLDSKGIKPTAIRRFSEVC